MRSFSIDVPADVLSDLNDRLRRTRFSSPTPAVSWAAGIDPAYHRDLVNYWLNEFDWRAREAELNQFPKYLVEIDDLTVHFVWLRGSSQPDDKAPIPIILSHGWPYSFIEMLSLGQMLAEPSRFGGDPNDSFDVVIPSLPGFGFSAARPEPFTSSNVATLWHRLMTKHLGYERFATYGEDVGCGISDRLAADFPESIIGIHATHPPYPPKSQSENLTENEVAFQAWLDEKMAGGKGYSEIQSTKPDTLAASVSDSPAGLAAWIVEKFRAWSDCDGDIERRFSKDQLLTTVMIYWITNSIGTSFRPYFDDHLDTECPAVTVPAGVSVSLSDLGMPREMVERTYKDIRYWNDLPRGGHFVAAEEPGLVAADIREFFRSLRSD